MSRESTQEYVRSLIADRCVEIEDIFKKDMPRYVTVIVRPPGKPEQEVIVTADPDPQAVIETIQRRFNLSARAEEKMIENVCSAEYWLASHRQAGHRIDTHPELHQCSCGAVYRTATLPLGARFWAEQCGPGRKGG